MSELAEIAGTGGWRTRCGELERGEWSEHVSLSLEKRQYTAWSAMHGKKIKHSERRYVPQSEPKQQALGLSGGELCRQATN